MNYQMFKSIIDSLIKNFTCPNCNSTAQENNIDIVWAAWSTVNIDIWCATCGKHTMVKAEMAQVDLWDVSNFDANKIDMLKIWLKKQLETKLKWIIENPKEKILINDNEIINLKNILKKENIKVQDFFS